MPIHQELIAHLREHAVALVNLARKSSEPDIANELETLAIELLKRASQLEADSRF
jgi:hypothetical protein